MLEAGPLAESRREEKKTKKNIFMHKKRQGNGKSILSFTSPEARLISRAEVLALTTSPIGVLKIANGVILLRVASVPRAQRC
jgi:hypothetical protein